MPALLLFFGRHWKVIVTAVASASVAFVLGHRLGVASVHCPAPECPEVKAEAEAGNLSGSLGCKVVGWHVVDLDPPAMVVAGPVPVPPKTNTVTRTVEVLRTVPGAPLPAHPCTDRVLVPDLELTASGDVQGPKAEASADPPKLEVAPAPVPAGHWFPTAHVGGGSLGALVGGGLGYRWQAGNALALEGSAVMSVAPVQSRGWEVRLRYDF